jgi:hypothetical protein
MIRLLLIGLALFASVPALAAANVDLEVTIGVDAGVEFCPFTESVHVAAGTAVRLCYSIENVGDVMLGTHDLADSEVGVLLNAFPYSLAPGASAFLTQVEVVNETTAFTATWTASTVGASASDVDTAVAIVPEPEAFAAAVSAGVALCGCAARRRAARRGAPHPREPRSVNHEHRLARLRDDPV